MEREVAAKCDAVRWHNSLRALGKIPAHKGGAAGLIGCERFARVQTAEKKIGSEILL